MSLKYNLDITLICKQYRCTTDNDKITTKHAWLPIKLAACSKEL